MIGPGLLGGSILKAVRKFSPKCELRIWARRCQVLESIQAQGLGDYVDTDLGMVVAGADLVVLAMPIQFMEEVVAGFPPLDEGVIVTDVGSVKGAVVSALSGPVRGLGGVFVGSHPMAGSEKTGIEYATEDLFCGASVIVTPAGVDEDPEGVALGKVSRFWSSIGALVSCLSPEEHDRVVAAISHLPHLLASSLVRSALRKSPGNAAFAAGGFRDTTRIASGDPDMWAEIMMANRDALLGEVDDLIEEVSKWREALVSLDKDTVHRFLSEAKERRDQVKASLPPEVNC